MFTKKNAADLTRQIGIISVAFRSIVEAIQAAGDVDWAFWESLGGWCSHDCCVIMIVDLSE